MAGGRSPVGTGSGALSARWCWLLLTVMAPVACLTQPLSQPIGSSDVRGASGQVRRGEHLSPLGRDGPMVQRSSLVGAVKGLIDPHVHVHWFVRNH